MPRNVALHHAKGDAAVCADLRASGITSGFQAASALELESLSKDAR